MVLLESFPVTVARRVSTTSGQRHEAYRSVVWLRGDHDIATETQLSETLARTIALDDADLVVDMSGVTFMDAVTVGALARARLCLRGQSRSFQLRSPSTSARRVLDLCGLSSLVEAPVLPVPVRPKSVE